MKNSTILLALVVPGIILVAGCAGPVPQGTETQETTVPVVSPAPAAETAVPTPSGTAFSLPREDRETVTQTPPPVADDPYLEHLSIRKRTFSFSLPECFMKNAFPDIIGDTYGLNQRSPNLAAVSEDDYYTFLRKHTEGNAESTPLKTPAACLGSGAAPTWNFIEVRVILIPRNVHAADYTITRNIVSDGRIVAKLTTAQRLVLDEDVTLVSYIPIRTDEVDLFDTVEMTYTRY